MRQGDVSSDHFNCDIHPCVSCQADEVLEVEDWLVIEFYNQVQDQVVNLTPMGVQEGQKPQMVPRLEGWTAEAAEMGFEGSEREMVIRSARILHEAIYNRIRVPGLMDLTPEDVRPLDEDEVVEDG